MNLYFIFSFEKVFSFRWNSSIFSKNVSFEIKNIIFSPIFDDSAVISSVISLLFLTHYIFSTFTGLFTGVDKFFVDPFGWFSGRLHFSLPDFFSSDDLSTPTWARTEANPNKNSSNHFRIAQDRSKRAIFDRKSQTRVNKWGIFEIFSIFWQFKLHTGCSNTAKGNFPPKSNFKQSWPFNIWLINEIFMQKSILGYFYVKIIIFESCDFSERIYFVPKWLYLTKKERHYRISIQTTVIKTENLVNIKTIKLLNNFITNFHYDFSKTARSKTTTPAWNFLKNQEILLPVGCTDFKVGSHFTHLILLNLNKIFETSIL